MKNDIIKSIKSLSSMLLVNEAVKRNIKVNHINRYQKEMVFLELSFKNHFEYIVGQKSSKTSATASYAVENKALTKSLLEEENISVAKGKLFSKNCNINEIYKYVKKIGYPVVVKKFDGVHGELVFLGINNKEKLCKFINEIFKKNDYVLIEKEFKGKEFRFIAAAHRIPANVIGDGSHNIKELIRIKNNDPRRAEGHQSPLTKIKIDSIVKQNLNEQNIKLDYIPNREEKIYLRKNSNLSTGGESIDVTDIIHPELKKIVVKSVQAIPGLAYAGVDLMTNKNISKRPTKNSYIIIEINSFPNLRMHHFSSIGKSRNVSGEIIDILFPETKCKIK
ncbi:MAG: hypothetical protein P1P85_05650 [Patescibacteria group bacterium]|nr:hypothetical protein [Patescibacteria group bacterium]